MNSDYYINHKGNSIKSIVKCKCSFCKKPLERAIAEFKRCKTKTFFCGISCRSSYKTKKINLSCVTCGKNIERNPSSIRGNVFCNSSCSATFNNSMFNKKQKTKKCKLCSNLILSDRIYCKECYCKNFELNEKTLLEATKQKGKLASKFSGIRGNARIVYRDNNLPKYCFLCGYDKHIEICHIKSISSFPESTLVKEINSISNLVALCRNHHWELDHKLLNNNDYKKLMGLPGLEPRTNEFKFV